MPVTVLLPFLPATLACSITGPYHLSPRQMVMELVLEN